MEKPRILIVNVAPLLPELGASQMAINLADSLRAHGAEVVLFVPQSQQKTHWLLPITYWRKSVEAFVANDGPFDIIDAPAQIITRSLSKKAFCIARSVQPELRYQWVNIISHPFVSPLDLLRFIRSCLIALSTFSSHLSGWIYAHAILCLGSAEKKWMVSRFPFWKRKIYHYLNALSEEDQKKLIKIRNSRIPPEKAGIRFLWIGRWTAHKGIDRLVTFIMQRLETAPSDTFTIAGCGPGPYHGMTNAIITDRRVQIIPHFKREELFDLLRVHDVGLFTSKAEGWGLSLNEMLESGMSVYATDTGGVMDLKTIFNSMLREFPPKETDLLCDEPMTVDWELYYKTFNWDAIAGRYLALYESMQCKGKR